MGQRPRQSHELIGLHHELDPDPIGTLDFELVNIPAEPSQEAEQDGAQLLTMAWGLESMEVLAHVRPGQVRPTLRAIGKDPFVDVAARWIEVTFAGQMESDFEHLLVILEAIAIDSAENEVVSAKDINKLKPEDSKEVIVIRDAAHCARRILSRLFRADPVVWYTFEFFTMIAKLLHWSLDLRVVYQECSAESITSAVSTKFSHLRAAKHRIETWLTPLSRSVLDPDGDCDVKIDAR